MSEVIQRTPRPAARILLLDEAGRVLLFRFDPDDRPPFWCTPGGALDPGESYEDAARRELIEETGLDLDCGPQVLRRLIDFVTLEGAEVTGDERYFLVRTPVTEISAAGHTPLEQIYMRSWRWFSRAEIAAHDERIYPEDLIAMLDTLEEEGR
jgi:8-oxo-dGTP diphosphatase